MTIPVIPPRLLDPSVSVSEVADYVGVKVLCPEYLQKVHKDLKAVVPNILELWDQDVPHLRQRILVLIEYLCLDGVLRNKLVEETGVMQLIRDSLRLWDVPLFMQALDCVGRFELAGGWNDEQAIKAAEWFLEPVWQYVVTDTKQNYADDDYVVRALGPLSYYLLKCLQHRDRLSPNRSKIVDSLDLNDAVDRAHMRRLTFDSTPFCTVALKVGRKRIFKNTKAVDTLVGHMGHPNIWARFQCFEALARLYPDSPQESPPLITLCTENLMPSPVKSALQDPHSQFKLTRSYEEKWLAVVQEAREASSLERVVEIAAEIIQTCESGIIVFTLTEGGRPRPAIRDGRKMHTSLDVLEAACREVQKGNPGSLEAAI
ncbi:hypothetical protein HK102_000650 [Quaeritorhiza haematococci]|nr:hypothetical protein HK102_000650 [Quaeritorhiza haematococci]